MATDLKEIYKAAKQRDVVLNAEQAHEVAQRMQRVEGQEVEEAVADYINTFNLDNLS